MSLALKCRNISCGRFPNINEDTVYCQYCGKTYSDFGINIAQMVKTKSEWDAIYDKSFGIYFWRVAGTVLAAMAILLFGFYMPPYIEAGNSVYADMVLLFSVFMPLVSLFF